MTKITLVLSFLMICIGQLQAQENGAEKWKDKYFQMHPDADTDKDGKLSWPEYKAHKAANGKKEQKATPEAEAWKAEFFKKYPEADTDKDGKLSWPEYKIHKNKIDASK